jgi:hypothetical protein
MSSYERAEVMDRIRGEIGLLMRRWSGRLGMRMRFEDEV